MTIKFFQANLLFWLLILSIPQATAESTVKMLEVIFVESEPGIEPYLSRYLLGDRYLRLDDGSDADDFILFDLNTHNIHSFNHEEGTHIQIKPGPSQSLDFKVDFQVKKSVLTSAPRMGKHHPVEFQFFADAKKCKQVVSAPGLLPEMSQVIRQYEHVLSEQIKTTLSRIPAEAREACYMANNYLHVSDYLDGGFPLHIIDYTQKQKYLKSYQQLEKPESIMQFPAGYKTYFPG